MQFILMSYSEEFESTFEKVRGHQAGHILISKTAPATSNSKGKDDKVELYSKQEETIIAASRQLSRTTVLAFDAGVIGTHWKKASCGTF